MQQLGTPRAPRAPRRQGRDAGRGAYKIMTTLNAEGICNPRTGDVWRLGTLQSILRTADRDKTPTLGAS